MSQADPPTLPEADVQLQVVAPVYRNRASLEELAARVHASLDGAALPSHELLLVVDGCPQGSAGLAAELTSRDDRLAVLELEPNQGQYRAVMLGLAHSRGRITLVMDADLQDPPENIPALLEALRPPVQVVFAARRGRYQSIARTLASRGFRWLFHQLTGLPRGASIHMAMSRSALESMLALRVESVFPVAMAGCLDLPTRVVPLEREQRPHGDSGYSTRDRLEAAALAFACVRECRRGPGDATPVWRAPDQVIAARHGVRFTPR